MSSFLDREKLEALRVQIVAHVLFSMGTAVEAVKHNKLRAGLTSLGILFGVASVFAMLAIGKGAEQEVLEQMRLLGSNNVVITPLVMEAKILSIRFFRPVTSANVCLSEVNSRAFSMATAA